MANERDIIKLEKEIIKKMRSIRLGVISPKDSGIGKMINIMKAYDEPLYEKLINDYKNILNEKRGI